MCLFFKNLRFLFNIIFGFFVTNSLLFFVSFFCIYAIDVSAKYLDNGIKEEIVNAVLYDDITAWRFNIIIEMARESLDYDFEDLKNEIVNIVDDRGYNILELCVEHQREELIQALFFNGMIGFFKVIKNSKKSTCVKKTVARLVDADEKMPSIWRQLASRQTVIERKLRGFLYDCDDPCLDEGMEGDLEWEYQRIEDLEENIRVYKNDVRKLENNSNYSATSD